jgi:hypothetical protein
MICHSSGHDDHPALQNNPSPELSPKAKWCDGPPNTNSCGRISSETRKQRRQRLFSEFPHLTKK